jgi:hypothetical protein
MRELWTTVPKCRSAWRYNIIYWSIEPSSSAPHLMTRLICHWPHNPVNHACQPEETDTEFTSPSSCSEASGDGCIFDIWEVFVRYSAVLPSDEAFDLPEALEISELPLFTGVPQIFLLFELSKFLAYSPMTQSQHSASWPFNHPEPQGLFFLPKSFIMS